jgi:hypothetical protein
MKASHTMIPALAIILLLLCGCVPSLRPWLDQESAISCKPEWIGEWWVDVADTPDRNKIVVTLEKEEMRSGVHIPERYHIDVYTRSGLRVAQLRASLHELNGVKLLQVGDKTRQKELDVASITSFSLWRIEGSDNSLLLWMPEFVREYHMGKKAFPVKTVKAGHELEQPIFVDSTENLKAFLDEWTKNYLETKRKLPLLLHRKGKPFSLPISVSGK